MGAKLIGRAQRNFRAVKMLCVILERQILVIIHLFRLLECTTPRINYNVNWTLGGYDVSVEVHGLS